MYAPSRKPHERMIANVQSVEALLQVAFGRGIKWLSAPIDDANYSGSVQFGEKICIASLKCFTVSLPRLFQSCANKSGLDILRSV